MLLRETNPAEFETYVQMAADAAKLAEDRPELLQALWEDHAPSVPKDTGKKRLRLAIAPVIEHGHVFAIFFIVPTAGGIPDLSKIHSKDATHH